MCWPSGSETRTLAAVRRLVAVCFLWAAGIALQAQPVTTIAEAIRDADGDTVPDHVRQPVHVRGVVTIGTGVVADDRVQVYLQDETAGIYIFSRFPGAALAAGEVIDVTGTLDQYRGSPQINRPQYRVIGHRPLPQPLTVTVAEAASWRVYGKLVRVRGVTGDMRTEGPNLSFRLRSGNASIRVLLPPLVQRQFAAASIPEGSTIEVTGVASIYSLLPPHRDGFRLIVGAPQWIRVISKPLPSWIEEAALVAVGTLIALLIAFAVARAIRRRKLLRNRQVVMLNALSAMAAGVVDAENFLEESIDVMIRNGVISGAVIHLLEGTRFRLHGSWRVDEKQARRIDEEVQSRFDLAASGRDFVIDDPSTVLGTGPAVPLVCVPLQGRSRTVGVLTAVAPRRGALAGGEVEIIATAANLVALGIENVLMLRQNEERQRELEQLAICDPLTGLYNRRFMDEYLRIHMAMASRQNAPVSFIAIDVDNFKPVNDQYGHEVGDRVLADLGELLRKSTRAADLAVRYGGEEFLVVMTDTGEGGAMTFASRLQNSLRNRSFEHAGVARETRLTISIGIAVFPDHGDSVRQLLRVADDSMYQSKRQGRDRITVGAGQPQMLD